MHHMAAVASVQGPQVWNSLLLNCNQWKNDQKETELLFQCVTVDSAYLLCCAILHYINVFNNNDDDVSDSEIFGSKVKVMHSRARW